MHLFYPQIHHMKKHVGEDLVDHQALMVLQSLAVHQNLQRFSSISDPSVLVPLKELEVQRS